MRPYKGLTFTSVTYDTKRLFVSFYVKIYPNMSELEQFEQILADQQWADGELDRLRYLARTFGINAAWQRESVRWTPLSVQ